jgi:hypothetical protein
MASGDHEKPPAKGSPDPMAIGTAAEPAGAAPRPSDHPRLYLTIPSVREMGSFNNCGRIGSGQY